mgnify:CR=1 FL=1
MGNLVAIDFQSRVIRTDQQHEGRVRKCLAEFEESGSYETALSLCRTACPGSEVGLAQRLPDGRWVIELRYDNIIHEGSGDSEAGALIDAILQISEATDAEDQATSRPYRTW